MDNSISQTVARRPEWLGEAVWPFTPRVADIDGLEVGYTDEGQGPTLLLVHDGMWSFVWRDLIQRMRDRYRMITLDFPGAGLSGASGTKPSMEGDSKLLERFADQLGLERATLMLHDLGGPVGLGMAARRPTFADGLVLMNTFAWPPDVPALKRMFAVMSSRPVRSVNVATNLVPRITSTRIGVGRNLDAPARAAFLRGFDRKAARRRFHDLMGSVRAESDYLAAIETAMAESLSHVPTLTIFGAKNDPFGFQPRFRDYLTDTEELIVEGGNHFPMCDDPHSVATTIAGWHNRKIGS